MDLVPYVGPVRVRNEVGAFDIDALAGGVRLALLAGAVAPASEPFDPLFCS